MISATGRGNSFSLSQQRPRSRSKAAGRVLIPLLKFIIFLQVCAVVSLFFTRYSKALVDRYFNRGEIKVPAFVGLSLENALQVAEVGNLGIKIVETRYSSSVPDNHIVSQSPDPGRKVRPGRKIHVVLSKGAFLVAAPEVVGKPFRTAGIILRNEGFSLGKTAYIHDEIVAVDTVICQTPRENSMIPKSTSIDLLVSLGKVSRMVKVPDFIGLSLNEARSLLSRTGLLVGKVSYTLENNERRNTVLAQLPKKDLTVDEGATVDFLVNGERPPEEPSAGQGGDAEYGQWAEQAVRGDMEGRSDRPAANAGRYATDFNGPGESAHGETAPGESAWTISGATGPQKLTPEAIPAIERGLQSDFGNGGDGTAAGQPLRDPSGNLLPGFDGTIGGRWIDTGRDKSTAEWEVKDSAAPAADGTPPGENLSSGTGYEAPGGAASPAPGIASGTDDFDSSDFGTEAEGFGYFSSAMKKQVLLEYVVPAKESKSRIQMVLIDSKGISKIYDSVHSAGEKLAVDATGFGKVKILIYVNRELVTQRDY